MASARDTDPTRLPYPVPHSSDDREGGQDRRQGDHAEDLASLAEEIQQATQHAYTTRPGGPGRRRQRAKLESLGQAARRWAQELERLRQRYEDQADLPGPQPAVSDTPNTSEREQYLERVLAEREAELKALRGTAAGRELDLQREHFSETRRQQEEIASLKKRLAESGGARDEELREVKRLAYERERDLRQTHAEKLSETEREAGHRVSALQAQREADNRSLMELHAAETARLQEELESLRLRRDSETRVYGERIEKLYRERAEERTSLEEAVAKLREKHEAERSRLQARLESLEEYLMEQESITVRLLGELGYVNTPQSPVRLSEAPGPAGELEVAGERGPETGMQRALEELHGIAAPGNLLREGLALLNETEHVKVIYAISKSLGEPEVYAALEPHGGVRTPGITIIWPGMGWRRYVSEPRSASEPRVYLDGHGENDEGEIRANLPDSGPNARLDGQGLLSLGVRPL